MNDRYHELMDLARLQSHAGSSNTSRSHAGHSQHRSNANPPSEPDDLGQELLPLSPEFHQILEMETLTTQIHSNNSELQSLCLETKHVSSRSKESSIFTSLTSLRSSNNADLCSLKSLLDSFHQSLSHPSPLIPLDPTDQKIYTQNYKALLEAYKISLTEYRNIEFNLKEIKTKKIKRQVKIVLGGKIKQNELDRLIARPDALALVLRENTLGKTNIQVQNTLMDIKGKYDEIIVLEGNVNHIMGLLNDMNDLIADQGDDVGGLLGTIQDAKGLTQKGQDNLVKAKEYYKATKKRQWWMCGCCCVAVIVV